MADGKARPFRLIASGPGLVAAIAGRRAEDYRPHVPSPAGLPITKGMTTVAPDVAGAQDGIEQRTTEAPCLVCVTTASLDDERPKTGTVQWEVTARFRLKTGTAVRFECPNGHSSAADPELLKAFPPRLF